MRDTTKLYVKVCEQCGRQVEPHVDHNLGPSRTAYCSHGRGELGTLRTVGWKKIEVVPVEVKEQLDKLRSALEVLTSDIADGRV